MNNVRDFFSVEQNHQSLKSKTIRGAAITGATQDLRVLIGLAALPVLARLLDPEDFGLFATVAIVTNFALLFVDAGLSMATVQREKITQRQVSNLFWVAVGLGIFLSIAVCAVSPLLAWAYADKRLIALTSITSLSYVLTGLTVQHQAILRRCMLFHRIAAIDITALLTGQTLAISWALLLQGSNHVYWALAFAPLGTSGARMIGVWLACRWMPSLPSFDPESTEMIRFGRQLTSGQLFNYLANHIDQVLIGYFLGDRSLGIYERSATLAVQPVRQVNGPLTAVSVPALSRLIQSPTNYLVAYRTALISVTMIVMPVAAVCIVAPASIVSLLMGPGWDQAVPLFQILACGLVAHPICNSMSWLLISQARGKTMFRYQAGDSMFKLILVCCGLPWGAPGVAIACVLRLFINLPFLFHVVGRQGPVSTRNLWKLFATQLIPFFSAMASTMLLQQSTIFLTAPLLTRVLVLSTTACLASTLAFLCFNDVRKSIQDTAGSWKQLHPAVS